MAKPVRRAILLFLLPGMVLSSLGAADPITRTFTSGGRVEMKLEAGEYEILPGAGDSISISMSGSRTDQVRVQLDGTGASARLAITDTPRHDFRAVIRVPEHCDLVVRHSAGDLRIGAIRGNKDLRTRAGNVEVMVGDTKDYRSVFASVTAGDLEAKPFQTSKGGLFNSFRWTGPGKYELKAKLMAGDLSFTN